MRFATTVCVGTMGALLAGCEQSEDGIVARVGPNSITSARVRAHVEELPDGLRLKQKGNAARRQYLQDIVDRYLLLMEAEARGLDTTQAVRSEVREAADKRARNRYRAREIRSRTQVSPAEARRYFEEEGFDRERKLKAILVASRDDIEAVLVDLEHGRSFGDIARERSVDETSAQNGGELGFVGRDLAERLNIPLETFLKLPANQVSEPLRAGDRWHVVRFAEERTASYDKYRQLVETRLRNERTAAAVEEHFEQLKADFGLRWISDGLNELLAANRQRTPQVLADSPTPFFAYDEGEITLGEVHEKLASLRLFRGMADSARATVTLTKYVLHPFLLTEAARRAGIYDEPDLVRLVDIARERILLETLRRDAIVTKITISEAVARQYYDDRPELFFHEGAVWIEELLLPTESAALEARKQLEDGVQFAALAGQSLREGAVEGKAEGHYHARERVLHPILVPAVLEAVQGELVGPLELDEGFSVFRVVRQDSGVVEPFATAKRRARGLLRRHREHEMLQVLLKELRERYADQIQIDEGRLRAALPDSLVGT